MRILNVKQVFMYFLIMLLLSCSTHSTYFYGKEVTLTGILTKEVFAGPPNYTSIEDGDVPETVLLLKMDSRIDVNTTASDVDGINENEKNVSKIQLVLSGKKYFLYEHLLMKKKVKVTGQLFHAHTGHHRTKVLIDTKKIQGIK